MKRKSPTKARKSKISSKESDLYSELMTAELMEQLLEASPIERQTAGLRRIVAQYGGAYFFHNQKGDFCLLTE